MPYIVPCRDCQTAPRAWGYSYCKACHRARVRKSREKTGYKRRHSNQKQWDLVLAAKHGPCTDCQKIWPFYVMDLDHIRGVKLFDLSTGWRSHTVEEVQAEIAKCEPVCANCHRKRTYVRGMVEAQDRYIKRRRDTSTI